MCSWSLRQAYQRTILRLWLDMLADKSFDGGGDENTFFDEQGISCFRVERANNTQFLSTLFNNAPSTSPNSFIKRHPENFRAGRIRRLFFEKLFKCFLMEKIKKSLK